LTGGLYFTMEDQQRYGQSPQTEAVPFLMVILTLITTVCTAPINTHQPLNLTWLVTETSTGEILAQVSKIAPLNTWFPELGFDLHALFPDYAPDLLWHIPYFYVCPGRADKGWRKQCGGAKDYFCYSWNCVSTGDIYWSPLIKDDLTAVTRNGTPTHQGRWRGNCPSHITSSSCNPIKIIFTNRGMQDGMWETGKTWGLQ
jgi:hypothetical protein